MINDARFLMINDTCFLMIYVVCALNDTTLDDRFSCCDTQWKEARIIHNRTKLIYYITQQNEENARAKHVAIFVRGICTERTT
jgi:hypothetical protein